VFIRNTIFQLLVFYARFFKRPTVTCLFLICYEAFFKKELSAKRKAKAKNNSPDSQEPTLNLLVAAERSDVAPSEFVVNLKKQSQFIRSAFGVLRKGN